MQDIIQIKVLGTPAVSLAGQNVQFKTRKALALLLYLALEGPQPQDTLLELLWPDAPSRGSLRTAALHLRAGLGAQAWRLHTSWCGLALAMDGVRLDVQALDTLDARGALACGHGEFLAGLYLRGNAAWDDYLLRRGEEWRVQYDERLFALAAEALARGYAALSAMLAGRRCELDPFSSGACQQLMGAFQAAGLGHRARAVWAAFCQRSAREFGSLPEELGPGAVWEMTGRRLNLA